jgi:TolB protein
MVASQVWAAAALSGGLALQGAHGVMYHFPQWSPDGTMILVSGTSDGDAELYLYPVNGGHPGKLTDNTASDDGAQFVDDGRSILFTTDRRGRSELFIMNADGSNQRLTDRTRPEPVSPDGRTRLTESVVNGATAIVAIAFDGTRRVLTTGPSAEQGSYSPDGQKIVYEQRRAGAPNDIPRSHIVVANADGTAPRVVASGTDPSWSPAGAAILFKTFDEATKKLWIATIRPDGTGLRRLAPGVHPHWSPDGHSIAFMQESRRGGTDIWIMSSEGLRKKCLTCP